MLGSWEGNPLDIYASPVTGLDADRVTIYGQGEIDCSGDKGTLVAGTEEEVCRFPPAGGFF